MRITGPNVDVYPMWYLMRGLITFEDLYEIQSRRYISPNLRGI